MKCIVTGGAGFIGSHVVDLLVKKGHEVIVLDNLSTGKKENINPKAKFHEADISYPNVKYYFENIDCVFHLAALPRIVRSMKNPITTHMEYVSANLNILQICREKGIKKFIYSSSSSVYGDQDTHLMNEEMTPKPKSPYALQKLMGEQYCTLYAKLFDMSIISLRYFNVYGERQTTKGAYALVIGKFFRQKSESKLMTIYGDGEKTRAYTHVSDVAKANVLAFETEFKSKENIILNIGVKEETSVNKIALMIDGKVDYIKPNPRGAFEERRKSASNVKANGFIGWNPTIKIEDGIERLK